MGYRYRYRTCARSIIVHVSQSRIPVTVPVYSVLDRIMFPGRHRLGDGAGGTVHTPPVLWAQTVTNAEVTMSFGGEYLFPEKWKIINDTPDDGQLSKTEKIRRGEVEFHRKTFVDDDWKYHHGRARQVRRDS